jgi:copper chaperone CopZ
VKARVRAVEGVTDVEIDVVRMELIVNRSADVNKIIEAVRRAGFDATRK